MSKLSKKLFAVLAIAITFLLLYLQPLGAKAILSNSTPTNPMKQPVIIATASTAPSLETAILGGKPISVLYITRAGDTVLVRCYPSYQTTIKIRAMGNKPNANTQKEGVMTCQPAS